MTQHSIMPFTYGEQKIRVITDEQGNPWWIAKDICEVLEIVNPTQAVQQLDDDERAMENIGRQGKANVINESGLYTLILRSNKPAAKPFRKWVTAEVLPAIRKTGSYHQPQNKPESLATLSREYHAALRMAKSNGLKGAQASLTADRCTKEQTGFSPLDLLGIGTEDLPALDHQKKSGSGSLVGLVPQYLDMLEKEWKAGRAGIQFTENKDRLEAVVTMRELLAEFNSIADRHPIARYVSAKQLAARCITERDLLKKSGWSLQKTSKINGIQHYLMIRDNKPDNNYLTEATAPLLSGEMLGKYQTASAWN